MSNIELDDFWDVGKLLPKRRIKKSTSADTAAVEITADPSDEKTACDDNGVRTLNLKRGERIEPSLIREYEPDNAFVKKVRVYTYPTDYRYYEDFRVTMHKYLRLTVAHAERTPFFSYLPQYSQLNSERMAWYLYWRSGCRRREYLQTDFSYVLLYIYELINFENPKYPYRIAEELCSLWRAYRAEYSQLDRYLPDWLCDYCLIHGVKPPTKLIADFLPEVVEYASLGEFYFGDPSGEAGTYSTFVVRCASGYNYKKSKYYTEGNVEEYDLHIPRAAAYALGIDEAECDPGEPVRSILKNDVFVGALCTSAARKSLRIECVSASRSRALRSEATPVVKYAENKLRAVLGIRSRLDVRGITDALRERVDEYFREAFGAGADRARAKEPDYMAFYDSDKKGIEYERALEIENSSWETTALMCESIEDGVRELFENTADTEADLTSYNGTCEGETDGHLLDSDDGYALLLGSLDLVEGEVLRYVFKNDQRKAVAAAQSGAKYLGVVCDSINERALEYTGDVLIECENGDYRVISDYESEVEKWLKI